MPDKSACYPAGRRMPLAAKHFDVIVGLDVHIVQPPGTVPPVPIPHPFVGIVLDPFDYLPLIGSTVTVNGLPRAQAGSAGLSLPPHLPIGGLFVKPPGSEGELFMGSSTVEVEGEPFGYLGLPALTCSDVGVPPPPRPPKDPGDGKPPKPKPPDGGPTSLMAPTSVVLPIPIGKPVDVGGSPTISIFSAAFMAARNAFAGLRKLQRQSAAMQRVSKRMHARADELMRAKGMSDTARHRVHTAICAVTGHPVDIATGKVFTDAVDLRLHGPLPLAFERKWLSTSGHRGEFGHGWHHGFSLELRVEPAHKLIAVRLADDRVRAFPLLELGERWFDRKEKIELSRDAQGYLLREQSGLAWRFTTVGEDGNWPVSSIEDRAGNRIELLRDARGRLIAILDSGRRRFPVIHDEHGRITEIRGPHPDLEGELLFVRCVYDRAGDLVEVHDALGHVRRYEYRAHLLVRETDRAGLSFHFEYDNGAGPGREPHDTRQPAIRARCIRTWGDGGIYDHRLDYGEGQTAVTNSLGARNLYFHGDEGLVERAEDPLGHAARVVLDEWTNELAEIDELGRTTRRTYDERSNVVEQVWADGTTARFARDAHDQLVRAIDQNGGWWQWRRDERGRLLARLGPDGSRLRLIWLGSQVEAIVDGRNSVTRLEYDVSGNLARAHLPDGGTPSWTHDRLGRTIAHRSPTGAIQRLARDAGGRIVEVHEPDGLHRRLSLDGEGRPVRIEDQNHTVELGWIGVGKLALHRDSGIETRYHYDTEEQLIGLTNAHGSRYAFERDLRGDVVAETSWTGDRRQLDRDAAGQITKLTRPSGASATYTWNRLGKLEQVVDDDGTFERFAYRADGLLTHARNETCAIKLERDPIGRVVREWQDEHWIESTWDHGAERVAVRSSFGTRVDIERDAMGRWTGMGVGDPAGSRWRANTKRDLLGDEIDRSVPGGARDRWSRDAIGRPRQQQVWDGRAVVRDVRYTWNVDARLDRLFDALAGQATEYEHDPLGRLAWAKRGDSTELRLPDAIGNLYRSGERIDRQYGADGRLLFAEESEGTVRYEYDADGQRVRMIEADGREWKYRWNRAGRLIAVERPDGKVVEFGYDALGRRVWKRFGELLTRWVWDGDAIFHEWVEEEGIETERISVFGQAPIGRDARAAKQARGAQQQDLLGEDESTGYVEPAFVARKEAEAVVRGAPAGLITWISDPETLAPTAKLVGERAFSVVCDHLGTPVMMLDESGKVVWAAEMSIWGDVRMLVGKPRDLPFRFLGQVEDWETGIYYNRFREFDPRAGTYLSLDPIGVAGGFNTFAYVLDPLIEVDPLGLWRRPISYPSPKKVKIDIEHIMTGHVPSGQRHAQSARSGKGKDTFPELTEVEVERIVRDAYGAADEREGTMVQENGRKHKMYGSAHGYRVAMYYNIDTQMIETAWPIPDRRPCK
jgi:RHS repeat-associated protein